MKQRIKFTMILKTIPERSKRDGYVYTCSIGYCEEYGFIRVYPMPFTKMKRWGIYEIEIEKNKRDSRFESWKLSTYTKYENFIGFEKELIYLGDANKDYILSKMIANISPSISDLNKNKKSIGVIYTNEFNAFWDVNNRFINTRQYGLFEDVEIADFCKYTKESKEKECRIIFNDKDGKHNLQLNNWQYYEFQRKFGATNEAFRFINNKKNNLIVVGNMYQYRNTWIGLEAFNLPEVKLIHKMPKLELSF